MHTPQDVAYVRTPAGQAACISDLPLSQHSKRLLLLVNGYTTLQHLAERLALAEPQGAIDSLVGDGLVAPARHVPGHRS